MSYLTYSHKKVLEKYLLDFRENEDDHFSNYIENFKRYLLKTLYKRQENLVPILLRDESFQIDMEYLCSFIPQDKLSEIHRMIMYYTNEI